MQPSTLRDVSREAGVSLATADRVTNGRAGGRAATMARVRAASEKLGYTANPFASRLARGGEHRLAFVLPRGSNPFMQALSKQIERVAAHLAPQRVAVEHALVQAAIDALIAAAIPAVTLVSDAPGSRREHYVGIDNLAAGRTAGTLVGRFSRRLGSCWDRRRCGTIWSGCADLRMCSGGTSQGCGFCHRRWGRTRTRPRLRSRRRCWRHMPTWPGFMPRAPGRREWRGRWRPPGGRATWC